MKLVYPFSALFVACTALAQFTNSPIIQWQNSFGGSNDELLNDVAQIQDGTYVLSGVSLSGVSGNKTNDGGVSGWIVFVDGDGNKTGELSLASTNGGNVVSVAASSDGGFVVSAMASIGGEPSTTLKYGADRSLQWIAPFGGAVQSTADNGYIVLGHMTNTVAAKLNSSGGLEWSHSFTNTGLNSLPRDVWQTSDGGYIGAIVQRGGGLDSALVVRLDSAGNELWHTNLAGVFSQELRAVRQTSDGGFVLAGFTQNQVVGGNTVYADAWVVRLDSAGGVLWQKRYGGGLWDEFSRIEVLSDGGFLAAGLSFSPANEATTKQAPRYGDRDYWLVRLDADGNRLWDATFGGSVGTPAISDLSALILTSDGGALLGGHSTAQPSGNKTSPNYGQRDYWIVKLAGDQPSEVDGDNDGVADSIDQCPDTEPGAVVNVHGCSVAQLCSCDSGWKNHARYVQCVQRTVRQFVRAGLLTHREGRQIVRDARHSDCGRRRR